MAGFAQLGVGGGVLHGVTGASRALLGMTRAPVRCWIGVAVLVFLQADALEANQVFILSSHSKYKRLLSPGKADKGEDSPAGSGGGGEQKSPGEKAFFTVDCVLHLIRRESFDNFFRQTLIGIKGRDGG